MTWQLDKYIDVLEFYLKSNDSESLVANVGDFIKLYKKNSKRLTRVLKQADSQQFKVLQLTEKLANTNKKVNTLLDNANQGFLYFDSDMIIGDEYSKEARKIFNKNIAHCDITTLLYEDVQKQNFLKYNLQVVLQSDELKQEMMEL